jgi:pimeloyl-ACP methyl ester carboxylesterase
VPDWAISASASAGLSRHPLQKERSVSDVGSPAHPATGLLHAHGLQLAYREWGRPATTAASRDRSVPLVLVHGLGATARVWDLVAPWLAGACRVVAVDQRGHGASDKPDTGYDLATVVEDTLAAADALGLGERFAVAGHAWGAHLAVALAAHAPSRVAALVLVEGGFGSVTQERQRTGQTWEQVREEALGPNEAGTPLATFLAAQQAAYSPWGPELEAIVRDWVEVLPDQTVRLRLARAHLEAILHAVWEHDELALLGRVQSPVLYVLAQPPDLPTPPGLTRPAEGPLPAGAEPVPGAEPAQHTLADKRSRVAIAQRRLTAARCVEVEWLADTGHQVPLLRPEDLARRVSTFLGHPCGPPPVPPG